MVVMVMVVLAASIPRYARSHLFGVRYVAGTSHEAQPGVTNSRIQQHQKAAVKGQFCSQAARYTCDRHVATTRFLAMLRKNGLWRVLS